MIKAMIFDFDGTIIDTETAWYAAFRDAYKEHEVELTLEQYSQCIGTSLHAFNPYEYLVTHMNLPIDLAAFRTSVQQAHTSLMEKEQVREGILDYLNKAKESGLKIGLATSSTREWIDKYLQQLGVEDYFSCISTADDVKKVKPDPELYLRTLEGLGVRADEAVAIEDSPNGSRAAIAAGMYCVVIPNAITQHLVFDPVHYQLGALSELDFQQLMMDPLGALKEKTG